MLGIDKEIESIQNHYNRLVERNRFLQNENDHLRSEQYKDDELAAMKETAMKLNYRIRHYGLDEKDWKEMSKWWDEHLNTDHLIELEADKKGNHKMGKTPNYLIEIREFAECTCYSIVCEKCKKNHNIYW